MSLSTVLRTEHGRGAVVELPRLALVILSGDQKGQEHVVSGDVCRIGKTDDNDLVIRDQTVSRAHCEILREARGYLIRDLGSTNGTLLDGAEIREAFLRPGAILTVGKIELKVRTYAERIEVLPSEQQRFGEAVGKSLPMRTIFGLLERLAPSDATVLLGGETGTGKDVVARAIHEASPRRGRPMVVVDCGAVVANLIESELFGHEKGSFTGATASRQGAFELADGGTLFLDEIGELPLDLQPKLLRVLEQRSFRRVGGNKEHRVDIRVVAASKRNLLAEVERGKFREDLYFRLAVVPIEMPPLRERLDDLPMLVEHLLTGLSGEEPSAPPLSIARAALEALASHDWPGNVRELRNVLARAAYMTRAAGESEIRIGHVPVGSVLGGGTSDLVATAFDLALSYRETKARFEEAFEKRYVAWLLEHHQGNISAAARSVEMDRKYLHKLAKKHGVHPSASDDD
ncbi:MAG: sigma 54-dependent Fis family transcriptional regulator [Sandaracinus sp.]|nr:sigma 54-dependent Fis family transcriptional regulator [Sandaracinus sp.]MCB9622752.1 sigma 54-dependent Fis family transcriptional regulator [Sandaracinus sp.]MCB9636128.1 sigma 54-dependent Fis family transcriptional regulator [Sandaracinus sp.]